MNLRRWLVNKLGGMLVGDVGILTGDKMEDVWVAVVIFDDGSEGVLFMLCDTARTLLVASHDIGDYVWAPMLWLSEEVAMQAVKALRPLLAQLPGEDIALRRYGPYDHIEFIR